jgi:hypothetical protein
MSAVVEKNVPFLGIDFKMITFVSIQIKKYMKKVLISLLAMLLAVSCVKDNEWEDIPEGAFEGWENIPAETIDFFSYKRSGGAGDLFEEVLVTADSIHYYYAGNSYENGSWQRISKEIHEPIRTGLWYELLGVYDNELFTQVKNGESQLEAGWTDVVFRTRFKGEEMLFINGHGEAYDKLWMYIFLLNSGIYSSNRLVFPETEPGTGIVQTSKTGYINMHLVPDKLPRASDYTTLVFENHTTQKLGYGNPYALEFYNDGKWQGVDLDMFFTLPYYTLDRQSAEDQRISIPSKHHIAGKYRVVKMFSLEGTHDHISICGEFVLE